MNSTVAPPKPPTDAVVPLAGYPSQPGSAPGTGRKHQQPLLRAEQRLLGRMR